MRSVIPAAKPSCPWAWGPHSPHSHPVWVISLPLELWKTTWKEKMLVHFQASSNRNFSLHQHVLCVTQTAMSPTAKGASVGVHSWWFLLPLNRVSVMTVVWKRTRRPDQQERDGEVEPGQNVHELTGNSHGNGQSNPSREPGIATPKQGDYSNGGERVCSSLSLWKAAKKKETCAAL